jgi:hypothetical protein
MLNERRFDIGDYTGERADAGDREQAIVVIEQEKYSEITIRLANTILELATAGFDAEERDGWVIAAIVEALEAIEKAGTELIKESLFDDWPPFPFSRNCSPSTGVRLRNSSVGD